MNEQEYSPLQRQQQKLGSAAAHDQLALFDPKANGIAPPPPITEPEELNLEQMPSEEQKIERTFVAAEYIADVAYRAGRSDELKTMLVEHSRRNAARSSAQNRADCDGEINGK